MAVLLGLLVALSYGAGDFLGGLASRRTPALAVVHRSQLVSLIGVSLLALVLPGDLLGADLLRGLAAGAVGLVGVSLLYRGLAAGAMSIVAPVTAVGAAVLPLLWGLLQGERPGAWPLVGAGLAVLAVALVSSPGQEAGEPVPGRARELALALVAGAAFGIIFILFADLDADAGLWPVAAARMATLALLTVGLLVTQRRIPRPAVGSGLVVAGAGLLDGTANAVFVYAAREGLLSLVAVLSSLYPAVTMVLASVLLRERVSRRQRIGLVLALGGVLLMAT